MKRILKASAAFALATTLIFSGAGAASATEEVTPTPEVSAEVQAPAETSTVEEAVVTPEVAAPAPAEAVEAPVVETAPAEPQAEVVTTDAQPQAPPVAAKTVAALPSVTVARDLLTWEWNKEAVINLGSVTLTKPAGGHNNIKVSGSPSKITIFSNGGEQDRTGQSVLNGLYSSDIQWVKIEGEGVTNGTVVTPPVEKVSYVTVLWEGTDVQWPKDGQTLVDSVKHDDKVLNKSWIDSHKFKPCTTYQGDLYVDDATTKALLDGGKLYGANNPKESWPDGVYQGSYSVVFKTDCAPALIEIPYPTMLANEVCGAQNDPVFTDPEWVKQYGSLVNGPWIDTKYKNQNGKWVVDGSAQIKPEFRKTHIWAGTAGTDKSSYLRWQMYPGTAPFVHEDTATVCPPVEVPANPKADITAICGAADITLTNPQKDGEANKTASYVVEVDGKFYGAYAVEPNKSETVKLTFPEDSGDHKVEVFQSGTSEWKSIAKATVESDCIPTKPDTKVEFSEWVDGEYECTATEVPQTRTKSVTTYELVDNKWVAQAPVVTTETQTRPLTAEEQEAADIECAGPQPENKVTHTEWVTGEYVCGDTTVQITRTETVTEYVREGAEWVEGESVDNFQTETRALTEDEIAELECAVTPPVTETPAPSATPTPAPEASGLAATGGELPIVLGGLGVLALVIGGAVIYLSRRKKTDEVAESVDAE